MNVSVIINPPNNITVSPVGIQGPPGENSSGSFYPLNNPSGYLTNPSGGIVRINSGVLQLWDIGYSGWCGILLNSGQIITTAPIFV